MAALFDFSLQKWPTLIAGAARLGAVALAVSSHLTFATDSFPDAEVASLSSGLLYQQCSEWNECDSLLCESSSCDIAPCDAVPSCDGCGEFSACDATCCDPCAHQSFLHPRWRKGLEESGIVFQNNLTQFYFGNVSGGINQTGRYGGHGDYLTNVDFGKLGVQEGLFLKIRAEHRIGETIGPASGAILPPTLAAELPTPESRDLFLTNFLITQAFSPEFVIFGGKLDTLDGDRNAFAHGRGVTQFSNIAFVANPIVLRTMPFCSLGAGFAYLFEGQPLFSFLVINPRDTVTSSGFDELFNDGASMSGELRLPTHFFGRTGHMLVGATYSTRDYVSLDQDPRILLPSIPIGRSTDSWSVYWNTDHYLCVDPCDSNRGWGYFTRAGVGDDENNPISYFWSMGLGGSSMLASRPRDTFGVGVYTLETSDQLVPQLNALLGAVSDGQGVEAFYNYQVNRSLAVTPDFQWISPARSRVDDAYLLGLRANLSF